MGGVECVEWSQFLVDLDVQRKGVWNVVCAQFHTCELFCAYAAFQLGGYVVL